MRADLTPLTSHNDIEAHLGHPLPRDASALPALRAKRTALRNHPERVRVPDPDRHPRDVARSVNVTLPVLAKQRPDVLHLGATRATRTLCDGEGRHWHFPTLHDDDHELLAAQPATTRLADALALALPEDFAWMRHDGKHGRADLLHVSFPSHWAPDTRAGASLLDLHQAVADGDTLRNASSNLMRAITHKGPFRRYVWSLNPTPDLDRHPATTPPAGTGERHAIDDTWFRVERQTTIPFPREGVALFTIRILVAPLATVLRSRAGRAHHLASAIRSMSDTVRAYKGLHAPRDLLDALEAFETTHV